MEKVIRYRELDAGETSGDLKGVLIQVLSNVLLFMLIFGMSATVDIKRIKRQLRNCYAISAGVFLQFIVMPLLGFIAVISLKNYGLTMPMGITLLIVTSSPGGSYSNWWCSLFNADLALSVAMTALSTIVSIAFLPLNLLLYAHFAYGYDPKQDKDILASVDFTKLIISLVIVISSIVAGLCFSYKFGNPRFQRIANNGGTLSGILLIIVSAIFSSSGESDAKPWNQHWSFYVGVALPCFLGLLIANIIAKLIKLEKPEIVTLSVECSYQNTGIATTAVLAMFKDPEKVAQAMAVPLFYGLMEMAILGLYCIVAWKSGWTKAPKEEKICVVLSKTYEILENDKDDVSALEASTLEDKELTSPRARLDTYSTECSGTVSLSDQSGISASNSSQINHSRSLSSRGDEDDIESQNVFQTIKEEINNLEVSEHELPKDDDVMEKSPIVRIPQILSPKQYNIGGDTTNIALN